MVAVLLVVYDRVRALTHVHRQAAVAHGDAILGLERALRLQIEPTLNRWLSGQSVLGRLSVDYYQYLHVISAIGLLVACYVLRPHLYRSARNALLLVNAVGFVVYALYPVAPPRLLPAESFVDMVARAGFGTSHGGPIPIDQYGAMPSLHLAWAAWVALVGFAVTELLWLRAAFVAHVGITAFVVVGTGNHYLLDVVMGVALAGAAVLAAQVPAVQRAVRELGHNRRPTPRPSRVGVRGIVASRRLGERPCHSKISCPSASEASGPAPLPPS